MAMNSLKTKSGWLMLVIGILISNLTLAQTYTDVTDTYLTNAGFNTNCNYTTGGTDAVATADPGNMSTVNGWTIGGNAAWSAAGTFEYGWNGTFNTISMPSSGYNGESGSGQGAIGFTVGWSGSIYYTQSITLPIGKYAIVSVASFVDVNSISSNLTGWIPASGDAVMSDLTSVSSLNTWIADTIEITLAEETTGSIQVGMQAFNSGSGSNTKLFFDYIQILKIEGDKTNLQQIISDATEMFNNQESVAESSTVYTDLETAITNAQTVYDNEAASDEEIIAAEDALSLAMENVDKAVFAYVLSTATYESPVDASQKIYNPDFELNGGSTEGWTTTLGIYAGANAVFSGAPSPNNVLDGDPDAATVAYQTISGMPAGVYQVRAIARGRVEDGPQMFLSAEAGSVFGSSNRSSIEVERIGDTGGALNYGFNQYELPFIALSGSEETITMGVYFEGDCGWSSADNFELYYYGETAPIVSLIKDEITALTDSSDFPSSYDLTEVNTLLSTDLTEENASVLVAALNTQVNTLRAELAKNMNTSLSDLQVDDLTIRGFVSETYAYEYHTYNATGTPSEVPTVTGVATSSYASVSVTKADAVPGTTEIIVTAGNGDQETYTVAFTYDQLTVQENYTATLSTFENTMLELSGIGQLTISIDAAPTSRSAINFVSTDAWVYFPNMRPSEVVASQTLEFYVNGELMDWGSNIRISPYLKGAMVIPHSSAYAALTAYSDISRGGTAKELQINQFYKTAQLGTMNDNIESFVLKKGYMATLASNEDGTGTSRVYIADKNDVIIDLMPEGLSNTVSLVVVRQWRWTSKKGWRGSIEDTERFTCGSFYDYNNVAYSSLDYEYVPMRYGQYWNGLSNFNDKWNSTHALFLNEPGNTADGGYTPMADAIALYPGMLASGLRVGTPACTDGNLSWLYEFMDEVEAQGHRIDFVAWHFYRAGYTAQGLYNTLKDVHDRTGRPLWITEFNNGCNWTYSGNVPTAETNGDVIESFVQMLDTTSFVERYFVWDGCNETLRMTNSGNGSLYPAGEFYQSFDSDMAFSADYYNDMEAATIQENATGFCSMDGTIETAYAYTGSGYVNSPEEAGSGIDYKVIFKSEGYKTISIQYASNGNQFANVLINGVEVASDVEFPSTGSLNNYALLPVTVYTGTGIADLRIEAATSTGLANIDFIELSETRVASCSLNEESYPVIISATDEQEGNEADNILDGTTLTRWSAYAFPQTVVIDYGENKSIVGTRISTYENRAYQYTIELDETVYFSDPYVVDRSSNTSTSQPISDDFESVSARYVRITVTGASGYTGDWASITEFSIVEGSTSVKPTYDAVSKKLIVYPNPATEQINVVIPDQFEDATLFIYGSGGQLLKQAVLNDRNELVDVHELSSGIYLLKVVKNNEVISQKLVIE